MERLKERLDVARRALVHRGRSLSAVLWQATSQTVIPAHAGIHCAVGIWIPACAGMTGGKTGEKLLPASTSEPERTCGP